MVDETITVDIEKISISEAQLVSKPVGFLDRMKRSMNNIIGVAQSRKMSVLWILLILVICVSWTIWIVTNFQKSMKNNTEGIHQQFILESEISDLTIRAEKNNQDELESKLIQAESRIFSGYKVLAEWLYLLTKKSNLAGIDLKYKLGQESEVSYLDDLISIPVEIEASLENKVDPYVIYHDLLAFMDLLTSEPWHQEMRKAGIENDGLNKAKLTLQVNIWMSKPETFKEERTTDAAIEGLITSAAEVR
ncbi:MAG: hypothetical protein AB8D52_00360 [Gammaproteobacteria bacterium]